MVKAAEPLKTSLKVYTNALQHWHESNDRHIEQIHMVLLEPLADFIQTDFK